MKKRIIGKKLSRAVGHRKALKRNLMESLIVHGRITTTLPKAQFIRSDVEKLITRAGEDTQANRKIARLRIFTDVAVAKLFEEVGPKYKERAGGYTRIIKLGKRQGDNTEMAVMELV